MKKSFLAALATGLLVFGVAGNAMAAPISSTLTGPMSLLTASEQEPMSSPWKGNDKQDQTDTEVFDPAQVKNGGDEGYTGSGDEGGVTVSGDEVAGNNGGTNPVPEPMSMLLMGTGLAGLMGIRARRKMRE